MFYLFNLYNDTHMIFPDAAALAGWWLRQFPNKCPKERFEKLNVTGNDMYLAYEHSGEYVRFNDANGVSFTLPAISKTYYTRQFLITDETGRHIDIRLWPESIWQQVDREIHKTRYWRPVYMGSKPHWHRVSGPFGHHKTMQLISSNLDADTANILTAHQVEQIRINKTHIVPGMGDWDWYEYKGQKSYQCSRSWKDQTKAAHQWAKHKSSRGRCTNPTTYRRVAETGEELCARLSKELCVKPVTLPPHFSPKPRNRRNAA